ncbi:trypsin-like peptidase domain-containing protein [Methylobacillus flagellatus]|uniref:trypsin-like peptidase domain-containing protein n=1 Tax=Methylobacillus flagellatus TaxID=405 RepID=UPI0010F4671C|nr:trypsin-like peptidase domain-containing protein [Methylobacillus flagellatus]
MTRLVLALLLLSQVLPAAALPTDELLQKANAMVVRVQVGLANGGMGVGSGVVVAKDEVVTNCHVVANAGSIRVLNSGVVYVAKTTKADWHHDLCLLKVEGLNAPVANIGSSKALKYQQPVFATGFPNFSMIACTSFGHVQALYSMEDSVIVRASATFRLGDSGGGLFDDAGNLVGVITLKSPGRNAYYYFMPVEWIQALMQQPAQASFSEPHKVAFWAESFDKWPAFMRVVQPYLTEDWQALEAIAQQWTVNEPENAEAWFYLAAAAYGKHESQAAEQHLARVVALNGQHTQALYYLGLIADQGGKRIEALSRVAMLNSLDAPMADRLKLAMGIKPEQ